MLRRAGLCLLLLPLLATPAQGALNQPDGFEVAFPFGTDFHDWTVGLGRLEAEARDDTGVVLFDPQAVDIQGLGQVCWNLGDEADGDPECADDASPGTYRVEVAFGSSVALDFPQEFEYGLAADHAISLFLDLDALSDSEVQMGHGMLASTVGGELALQRIGAIAPRDTSDPRSVDEEREHWGGIVTLDEDARVRVMEGSRVLQDLSGQERVVAFTGEPRVAPVSVQGAIVPFPVGSAAHFSQAPDIAAQEGLEPLRLQGVLDTLAQWSGTAIDGNPLEELGSQSALFAEILNAGLLRTPPPDQEDFLQELVLVRAESMSATATASGVGFSGDAHMHVQDGKMQNVQALHGVPFFGLPWWSWLLMALALGAFVARVVVKPEPKRHETWDKKYWWVGLAAGVVMLLLVFFLWDLEMRAVWGASMLDTETSGGTYWVTAGLQLATFFFMLFAVAWPVKVLVQTGLQFGRQGRFMGLSYTAALLVGLLLGAALIPAFLGFYMDQVIGPLAG